MFVPDLVAEEVDVGSDGRVVLLLRVGLAVVEPEVEDGVQHVVGAALHLYKDLKKKKGLKTHHFAQKQ